MAENGGSKVEMDQWAFALNKSVVGDASPEPTPPKEKEDPEEMDQWAFALQKVTDKKPQEDKAQDKDKAKRLSSKKSTKKSVEKQGSFVTSGKRRLGKKNFRGDKEGEKLKKCNSTSSLGDFSRGGKKNLATGGIFGTFSGGTPDEESLSDNPGYESTAKPVRRIQELDESPGPGSPISQRLSKPGDPRSSLKECPSPIPPPLPDPEPEGGKKPPVVPLPPSASMDSVPKPLLLTPSAPPPPPLDVPLAALPPPITGGLAPPPPGAPPGLSPGMSPRLSPRLCAAGFTLDEPSGEEEESKEESKESEEESEAEETSGEEEKEEIVEGKKEEEKEETVDEKKEEKEEIVEGKKEEVDEDEAKKKEEKNRRMRKQVLQEILQTEEEYVKDLDIVINVFLTPCRIRKGDLGITDVDINGLFSNIETLKPLHTRFRDQLLDTFKESEESGQDPCIGAVFIELSSFFKMYMQYCANYPLAVKHQDRLMKENKKFSVFMKKCEGDKACKNMLFGSWVIKPVQRLCKYPLLLRELKAQSPEGHPDHDSIEMAKSQIDSVVDVVNEGKRTAERQMKIIEIQDLMDNLTLDLVTPSRRFVREGDTELRHKITGKGENRHLFLFNDLVVIARSKGGGRYEYKRALDWEDSRFIVISEQGKVKHGFEIAHGGERYIFSCESKKMQDDWVADFKMMTKELKLKKLEEAKKAKEAAEVQKAKEAAREAAAKESREQALKEAGDVS